MDLSIRLLSFYFLSRTPNQCAIFKTVSEVGLFRFFNEEFKSQLLLTVTEPNDLLFQMMWVPGGGYVISR